MGRWKHLTFFCWLAINALYNIPLGPTSSLLPVCLLIYVVYRSYASAAGCNWWLLGLLLGAKKRNSRQSILRFQSHGVNENGLFFFSKRGRERKSAREKDLLLFKRPSIFVWMPRVDMAIRQITIKALYFPLDAERLGYSLLRCVKQQVPGDFLSGAWNPQKRFQFKNGIGFAGVECIRTPTAWQFKLRSQQDEAEQKTSEETGEWEDLCRMEKGLDPCCQAA